MSRASMTELANVCVVCDGDRILVEDKKWRSDRGIVFPGGHVEANETMHDAVVREIYEETGLTIEDPVPCGFKDWTNDEGYRYLVLIYKAEKYSGELKSSDEGRVFWVTREEFEHLDVIWQMREVLSIADGDYSELFLWHNEANDTWEHKLIK